jgi:hypothetical protein
MIFWENLNKKQKSLKSFKKLSIFTLNLRAVVESQSISYYKQYYGADQEFW